VVYVICLVLAFLTLRTFISSNLSTLILTVSDLVRPFLLATRFLPSLDSHEEPTSDTTLGKPNAKDNEF
jgi:hypothetical protein